MYREQFNDVTSQQSNDADGGAAAQDHGLPPALHARVSMLGPADAEVLGGLVIEHPELANQILTAASWTVGLSGVRRAMSIAEANGANDAAFKYVIC